MIENPWIAPKEQTLPDFIIAGAMKSGTSTVHDILNQHSKVYIPSEEIHFFDIDDIFQHPDFNFFENGNWIGQDISKNYELMWSWYDSFFKNHSNKILGEDSTNYLASSNAFERIQLQEKPIKVIVMLRDPVKRAISQYYHMLRTGRAMFSFENTLKYHPEQVLQRSFYKEQLIRMYKHLPEDQVHVVLFEEFLADKEKVMREICSFLTIDYEFNKEVLDVHSNKANVPASPKLQYLRNRFLREFGNVMYTEFLPSKPVSRRGSISTAERVFNKIHSLVNPQSHRKAPQIRPESIGFLNNLFRPDIPELEKLIHKDLNSKWLL